MRIQFRAITTKNKKVSFAAIFTIYSIMNKQMNTAVRHVSELSGKTREGIEVLTKEIAQFKVE